MPESEITKKLTRAIKTVDKLLRDIQKDGREVMRALEELKEHGRTKDKD